MKVIILALTGWMFSIGAHAQLSVNVLELMGQMKLRQICYSQCSAELDLALSECNAKYPDAVTNPTHPERNYWENCVASALADYYNCTEGCPPFEQELPAFMFSD